MSWTTAAEYGKKTGVATSTARRRLEALAAAGKAERSVSWEDAEMPRASYGLPTPPPHKVVSYWLPEAAA